MSKPRHEWNQGETNRFTTNNVCAKCGLVRYKALNVWHYALEQVTEENMFPGLVENKGCYPYPENKIKTGICEYIGQLCVYIKLNNEVFYIHSGMVDEEDIEAMMKSAKGIKLRLDNALKII